MNKIITLIAIVAMLTLTAGYSCFAANVVSVGLTANVPPLSNGITATISRITRVGTDCDDKIGDDTWLPDQSSIAFGTLTRDTKWNIWRASNYFAVDLGVLDNSGNIWTITHTRTNFVNFAGTENLNDNVNVAFTKVYRALGATKDTVVNLQKVSYNASNNIQYTKTQLKEGTIQGWLRIYYGLGTGGEGTNPVTGEVICPDATGVSPILLDKPAGLYTGSVTLTLAGV